MIKSTALGSDKYQFAGRLTTTTCSWGKLTEFNRVMDAADNLCDMHWGATTGGTDKGL